jgi:hypothetical protein
MGWQMWLCEVHDDDDVLPSVPSSKRDGWMDG